MQRIFLHHEQLHWWEVFHWARAAYAWVFKEEEETLCSQVSTVQLSSLSTPAASITRFSYLKFTGIPYTMSLESGPRQENDLQVLVALCRASPCIDPEIQPSHSICLRRGSKAEDTHPKFHRCY